MKKILSALMAVVLVIGLSSAASALTVTILSDTGYVGEYSRSLATIYCIGGSNHSYSISGELPPGCNLVVASNRYTAYIAGAPTKAGEYNFSVSVTAEASTYDRILRKVVYFEDHGYASHTIKVEESRTGNTGNTTGGGEKINEGTGQDIGGSSGGCNSGLGLLGLLAGAAVIFRRSK